jgi:hypothetical protein
METNEVRILCGVVDIFVYRLHADMHVVRLP